MRLGPAAAIRYLTLGKIGDWFRGIKHNPRKPQRHTSLILDPEKLLYDHFLVVYKLDLLSFSKITYRNEKSIPDTKEYKS